MLVVQKATPQDALGMAIVNVYTWKTQYSGLIPEDVIDFRIKEVESRANKMRARINEDGRYLVAKQDDTVVGFCRYNACMSEGYEDYGEIYALYLLEGFKGKGLGRKMFEMAKEELEKLGFLKFRVNCLKGNPSLDFYLHMGGKVIGEFKGINSGQEMIEDIVVYE